MTMLVFPFLVIPNVCEGSLFAVLTFAMFFRDFSRSFEMTESSMFVILNVCEGSLFSSVYLRFLVATLCRNDKAGVLGFLSSRTYVRDLFLAVHFGDSSSLRSVGMTILMFPFLVIPNVCEGSLLELITTLEEVDSLKFLAHCSLLLVCHVLEWSTVLAKVKANELHDTLSAHDVTTVVADDVDYLL